MASVSQEFQGHNQANGSGKVKVTILASEWGSSKGGLSTINRKLAIQLAKFSEVEITFFVPQCSEVDKKEALSHNINIVEAKKFIGFEDLELLCFPPDDLLIEVVIGHGVKLGRQAQVIRDRHKCKWVQVVHTDPEELGMFKSYPDPISKGEEKRNIEVKLCEEADFVVAIGPKLAESFRRYLQSCKNHQTIFDFTPGIFEEFLSVDQGLEGRKDCTVLVFGRGDAEDFQLKGFDIVGKAVASLADTHLIFVGAPDGKYQEIAQLLLECDLPANCLKVRGYVKCRESLRKLFCEVDLVVMPSRTDGFGLTGLEALSAGLPVLVSKNSGFGESLSKVPFGSSFVIDSEKPEVWAAAIKNIWDKERQSRLEEVQVLRSSYERKYSWTKQSDALLVKIINLVRARLRLQIGCEVITGASAQTGTGTLVTPQQPQEVIQGVGGVPSSSNEQHCSGLAQFGSRRQRERSQSGARLIDKQGKLSEKIKTVKMSAATATRESNLEVSKAVDLSRQEKDVDWVAGLADYPPVLEGDKTKQLAEEDYTQSQGKIPTKSNRPLGLPEEMQIFVNTPVGIIPRVCSTMANRRNGSFWSLFGEGEEYSKDVDPFKALYGVRKEEIKGIYQTKGMACSVYVKKDEYPVAHFVTWSGVTRDLLNKPVQVVRFSSQHIGKYSAPVDSNSTVETFGHFSFLPAGLTFPSLSSSFIVAFKPFEQEEDLEAYFFVRSEKLTLKLDTKTHKLVTFSEEDRQKLELSSVLGAPIIVKNKNISPRDGGRWCVVGVVGLSREGELCPHFVTSEIFGQPGPSDAVQPPISQTPENSTNPPGGEAVDASDRL
ncbi:uncharacterized protein [Montipora foliosa]|uniref:uncharacterized protein isoform X2 n=1 Tax=Montipora foliosa TaxID=591990 RepID=UPI0035F12E7E